MNKKAIYFGMFVGSMVGGWVPAIWHAGMFSLWSIVLSMVGGLAGIWVAWRLGR